MLVLWMMLNRLYKVVSWACANFGRKASLRMKRLTYLDCIFRVDFIFDIGILSNWLLGNSDLNFIGLYLDVSFVHANCQKIYRRLHASSADG